MKEVTQARDVKCHGWHEETCKSSAARRGSLSLAERGRAWLADDAPWEDARAAAARTGWSLAG